MFDKWFAKKYKIERNCHSCLFRHCCRWDFNKMFPNAPDEWDNCKHWKLGKCYTCKFVDDAYNNEDSWFKRGCESECFGGCRRYIKSKSRTNAFLKLIRENGT